MGRCFSCGSELHGGSRYLFHCPTCATVEEIEGLREDVAEGLAELAIIQEQGFKRLADKLSEISSILEWGFTELSWQLDQQTDVLQSIDHTLKTPNGTQAKELRQMAEELRKRGVIDESEKRFLKSIELSPLDYRSYVGLALTYLHMGRFDESKILLEKSLPEAPKKTVKRIGGVDIDSDVMAEVKQFLNEGKKYHAISLLGDKTELGFYLSKEVVRVLVDHPDSVVEIVVESIPKIERRPAFEWKSYSYKLIGRILFCQENYVGAVEALKQSIQLSPKYGGGYYDHAQYCALIGKNDDCLASLKTAIMLKPFFRDLAAKEKNFDSVRNEVQQLRDSLLKEALDRADGIIPKCEEELRQTEETIRITQKALINMYYKHFLGEQEKHASIQAKKLYDEASYNVDSAKKDSELAKKLLIETKQAAESRSFGNIITLEVADLPKLVNNSREAANKAFEKASAGAKLLSGCLISLLSLIVIVVIFAVGGTWIFALLV